MGNGGKKNLTRLMCIMLFQLLLYLGMLIIGVFIGRYDMTHEKLDRVLTKLQILTLIGILFVMGIRLGGDDRVVDNLGSIGFRAFGLALGSIIASVLFVYIGRKLMHLGKGQS